MGLKSETGDLLIIGCVQEITSLTAQYLTGAIQTLENGIYTGSTSEKLNINMFFTIPTEPDRIDQKRVIFVVQS